MEMRAAARLSRFISTLYSQRLKMRYTAISQLNRKQVNQFLREHWFSTQMVIRGAIVDMTKVDGIIAYDESQNIIGLLTYQISGTACEITSLDSLRENCGIGSTLVKKLIEMAEKHGCEKVVLITTNDNINAIRFYQKRGFDMAKLYRNALEVSRKLKPEIPLIGDDGIPLRHEIEFELSFQTQNQN
jgi:ribosomal protein S18 acetylase RimI-like enzyme